MDQDIVLAKSLFLEGCDLLFGKGSVSWIRRIKEYFKENFGNYGDCADWVIISYVYKNGPVNWWHKRVGRKLLSRLDKTLLLSLIEKVAKQIDTYEIEQNNF